MTYPTKNILNIYKNIYTLEQGRKLAEHYPEILPRKNVEEKAIFFLLQAECLRSLDIVFQIQRNSEQKKEKRSLK